MRAKASNGLLLMILLATASALSVAQGSKAVERRVRIAQPRAADSRYVYVPFDVPAGTIAVTVELDYDHAGGANTIDLGIFDARFSGSPLDQRGFRGWSGGRRNQVTITPDRATPGYVPGPIQAGTWRVILGLYRVAPEGVEVVLRFTTERETSAPAAFARSGDATVTLLAPRSASSPTHGASAMPAARAPQRASLPPSSEKSSGWFRGDLHMHTVHSDGDWTIEELTQRARSAGLDFIAITDHNTMSHHAPASNSTREPGPLVILGEEVTTYGGHFNAWGLRAGQWIDFRVPRGDQARMESTVAGARARGVTVAINHPFALCGGCDWGYGRAISLFDAIEVWNGDWDVTDERALRLWDETLRQGRKIAAIGASDSHRPTDPLGQPTTHVRAAARAEDEILAAIRKGRVYVTARPDGPELEFTAAASGSSSAVSIGDALRSEGPVELRIRVARQPEDAMLVVIADGAEIAKLPARREHVITHPGGATYYRLELRDRSGRMLAFTNPIYTETRTTTK